MSYTDRTREFYTAFHQHIPEEGTPPSLLPPTISEDRLTLKMALIAEEFAELVEAVYGDKAAKTIRTAYRTAVGLDDQNRDVVEAADATADLRVVLDGFDIECAIPTEAVLEEVFSSNMSKLDDDGQPILSDGETAPVGKIMKSNNYVPPNVRRVLFPEEE